MPSSLWQYWRGLSGWNFYFLVKFGLLWAGYLNFHPLLNLVFAALTNGITAEAINSGSMWGFNVEYRSYGPMQAKIIPFVEINQDNSNTTSK